MPTVFNQAQAPLEFIPPAFNPLVWQVAQRLLPLRLRWGSQIASVSVEQVEQLVTLYQQFQAGTVRFLIAFRHPSVSDPECMFHLLSQEVTTTARQMGVSLRSPIHAHFIYDRGIPLWAGAWVGWLYSRLGGVPIRRGKVDLMGLRTVRQLFANGSLPVAAAPEGATNGHNELVSPVEPGIAQFGFWCLDDLQKEGRSETVVIVPVGIQYHYVSPPWRSLAQLLQTLEADSGIAPLADDAALLTTLQDGTDPTPEQQTHLYQRLYRLGEHLLTEVETFYRTFYHQPLTPPAPPSPDEPAQTPPNHALSQRLQTLLNAGLNVAEQFFGLQPKGTVTDRCRRLEQAGWDWIFREDLKQLEALSPVERGLADRIAEEADLRLWHMRLVESFVSVTGRYVSEKPTVERFAETMLLLWETVTRIKGKNPFPRPELGLRSVHMTIGEPISVSDRASDYQRNRRQAVATLTQDLQTALESMIR